MARFIAIFDPSPQSDLARDLSSARDALCRGGSREYAFEHTGAACAALVLAHTSDSPFVIDGDSWSVVVGSSPVRSTQVDPAHLDKSSRPGGRSIVIGWSAAYQQMTVATEPNGQLPLFAWRRGARVIVTTEPKAIWVLAGHLLHPDPDGIVDAFTIGHCLERRTLFREIEALDGGSIYRFVAEETRVDSYHDATLLAPAGTTATVRSINDTLLEVLEGYRQRAPAVSVALSGGMDSRYVLAAATRVWDDLDTFTFGEPESLDAALGEAVAAGAGVANRRYLIDASFLSDWASYAVWRSDGLVNILNAVGLDACLQHAERARFVLNGIGGDFLLGAFLRPSHLVRRPDARRGAREHLAARRCYAGHIEDALRPSILAAASRKPADALEQVFARYQGARQGDIMMSYWLRHDSARYTTVGLSLEAPFVEYLSPLIDPAFVQAVGRLPLNQKFVSRTYPHLLRDLAPDLARLRVTRTQVRADSPWLLHAVSRLGQKYGVIRRPRPLIDFYGALRSKLVPWLRSVLLAPDTLDGGFFQPEYLERLVRRYERREPGPDKEIGMVVTLETWRRTFVEGNVELAKPPRAPASA